MDASANHFLNHEVKHKLFELRGIHSVLRNMDVVRDPIGALVQRAEAEVAATLRLIDAETAIKAVVNGTYVPRAEAAVDVRKLPGWQQPPGDPVGAAVG